MRVHERLAVRVFEELGLLGHHTGATSKEKKEKKTNTGPGEKRDSKRKYTTYMKQSTRRKIEKCAHMNTKPKVLKNKTKAKTRT